MRASAILKRAIGAGLVSLLALGIWPSPANADKEAGQTQTIDLDVTAQSGGAVAVSDSPWNDCTFKQLSVEEFIAEALGSILAGLYGGDFSSLFEFIAANQQGNELTDGDYEGEFSHFNDVVCPAGVLFEGRAIWPVGTTTPQVVVDAVTDIARSRLTITSPAPNTAPTGTLDNPSVVNLPTFLWIDQGAWAPSTSTASIPGLVSVTVTATPTAVTWDLGDGSAPKTCNGPGTPWTPGLETTNCQHTYERSSANQPDNQYTLRATTHYNITTACTPLAANTTCGSTAPLGGVNLTYTDTMAVAEVQAVNT